MSQKASVDMAYLATVKEIANKYATVMRDSLKDETDFELRQQVYYCAYGATMAMFETVANLIAFIPKSQREQAIRVHQLGQEILTMCSSIDAARLGELKAHRASVNQAANEDKH